MLVQEKITIFSIDWAYVQRKSTMFLMGACFCCKKLCALRWRNTRYKTLQVLQNPSSLTTMLFSQHCFIARFGSIFCIFNLLWSTCRATKMFVAGWRKLLQTHNLSYNKFAHVAQPVEGFCIAYLLPLKMHDAVSYFVLVSIGQKIPQSAFCAWVYSCSDTINSSRAGKS